MNSDSDIEASMYTPISSATPCVRLLTVDGPIGCSSKRACALSLR